MDQVTTVETSVEIVEIEPLVTTDIVTQVFDYGSEHDKTFIPKPYRGLLVEPFTDDKWYYEEYVDQPLTEEAERRLFLVGTMPGIKIDQIIYAKELEEPAPDVDPWKLIVTGAGIIAAATAALAVGIAQALLSDPALIVVVDDQWIQLHSWV